MDTYSLALNGAVIAVAIALAASLAGTIYESDSRHIVAEKWRRVGTATAAISLLLNLAYSLIHLGTAHGAGSGSELGFGDFLSDHPVLVLIAGLAGIALWWSGRTKK